MQATLEIGLRYGLEVWAARVTCNGKCVASYTCWSETRARQWLKTKIEELNARL
jgi:hypothetical protein